MGEISIPPPPISRILPAGLAPFLSLICSGLGVKSLPIPAIQAHQILSVAGGTRCFEYNYIWNLRSFTGGLTGGGVCGFEPSKVWGFTVPSHWPLSGTPPRCGQLNLSALKIPMSS